MKICGIYKIQHKETGKVYIGLSVDIHARWKQHRSFSRHNGRSAIHNALRKYGIDAFDFSVIEECDRLLIESREQYWIQHYNSMVDGYNLTAGGEQSKIVSVETRQKIAQSLTGKVQSKEVIEKRALKLRGKKRTPEQNAVKSALMKGYGKGRKLPEWVKEKIGKPFLGRKHTEESKAKMSEAKKGKTFSEEHRKKLGEARKGKRFTEERKLKHSLALKEYWAKRKAEKEMYGRNEAKGID